jgi:glutathione S-transferase
MTSCNHRLDTTPMALTLYGSPRSRAAMVRWYLAERDIPYVWQVVDLAAGEQRQEAFRTIHPFGKVPALADDSLNGAEGQPLNLFESGAILMHLAEHHAREFEGEGGARRRALTAQWVLFANASFGPAMMAAAQRPEGLSSLLQVLDPLLSRSSSLLDATPTQAEEPLRAADCAVRAYLAYLPLFCSQVDLSPYPAVQASIAATSERPAYRQVMGG